MKKITIITALLIGIISSCEKSPVSTNKTDNEEFNVELLFTVDSIKVYRFRDGGGRHYFTKNMTLSTKYYNSGKTHYQYEEEIPNN